MSDQQSLCVIPLHEALYARLEGGIVVTLPGRSEPTTVPVVDTTEEDQRLPFVQFGDWAESGPPNKDSEEPEVLVDLEIYTESEGAADAAAIAGRLLELLTDTPLVLTDGWHETDAMREQYVSHRVPDDSGVLYREAVLTMKYTISRE